MAELEHGFTTRNEWSEFFNTYFMKVKTITQNVQLLSSDETDFSAWLDKFRQQAKETRALYTENDEYLNRHIYYFIKEHHDWSRNIADPLLAYLFRYCIRIDDVEASFSITESLYTYYEQLHDEISLMKCILVYITCYSFLDEIHFHDKILNFCNSGKHYYEKYYHDLSEEDKSMGLSFYDFESVIMLETIELQDDIAGKFDHIWYPAYKHRITMLNNFMRHADMSLDVNKILPYVRKSWINTFSAIILKVDGNKLKTNQKEILYEIALQQCLDNQEHDNVFGQIVNELIVIICQNQMGYIEINEVNEHIKEMIKQMSFHLDKTNNTLYSEAVVAFQLLSKAIDFLNISLEEKIKHIDILLTLYEQYFLQSTSKRYEEYLIAHTIYDYLLPLLKYKRDVDCMFQDLMKFTVFRQPQTAIHTIMVSKLASSIMTSMLQRIPESTMKECGYDDLHVFLSRKDYILTFVRKAALVHDIGKLLYTHVINMQYRKLIPLEYQTIQFHPITSNDILAKIPTLSCYKDVALGHHKSYDNKTGYPTSFNREKSRYKLFIDLISICDSIDAATDTLGRNYAKTKSLTVVLHELDASKGTRYSPFITDHLLSTPNLQSKLEEILSSGRREAYEYIYHMLNKCS